MAWFMLGLLSAAFAYLAWLSWFDTRHRRPMVSAAAALLAAAYLAVLVVAALSPWIALPVGITVVSFVAVEIGVRIMHRLDVLAGASASTPYPVENP